MSKIAAKLHRKWNFFIFSAKKIEFRQLFYEKTTLMPDALYGKFGENFGEIVFLPALLLHRAMVKM